jgi:methyl-accepting chemotaxis protein
MKNEKVEKLLKAVTDVRNAVAGGVEASKEVIDQTRKTASKVLSRKTIHQGLETTSKGAEIAAKGVDALARTLEKASSGIKKLGRKISKNSP